ncbi:MAG: hypothetical protein JJU00_11560 [Opitutales bacterium]|nr:hypothetical protein [Opitutales bacterium]
MSQSNPKLEWCVVRLGEDLNWWVTEISDPVHWDVDGLGVIDPRQMSYILEQCDLLREYGFDADLLDEAFFAFGIDREEKDGTVRIVRTRDSLLEDDTVLFCLPDVIDEEKGPYADFLDQITKFRVKLLNDLIDFDENITVDEIEEDIRERQNQEYMEGRAVHPFNEITAILDYVPEGYELEDEDTPKSGDEEIDDLPDFEDEDDEKIEEDETMRWDDDEEEEPDDDSEDALDDDEEEDALDDDEEEDALDDDQEDGEDDDEEDEDDDDQKDGEEGDDDDDGSRPSKR